MQKPNDQKEYFLKYLSLAPVLAVVSVSVAFSTWAILIIFYPIFFFILCHDVSGDDVEGLSSNTVQLRIIVGWVEAMRYPTKPRECWVSFLNPTYAKSGF